MQSRIDRQRRAFLQSTAISLAGLVLWPGKTRGEPEQSVDLEAEFVRRDLTGTFVHLNLATDRLTVASSARAQTRFIPASTFKVPNSLIAIETAAVSGPDEMFEWDGKPALVKDWQRRMPVSEAIRVSNVPVFQQIARRVGLKSYEQWLDKLGYGNANPGTVVDNFWLDGPLTISAIEQTSFLAALALEELPMSKATQATVKSMLLLEEKGGRRLFGKTGWVWSTTPQVGWWVGWVEGQGRIDTFALNIDMTSEQDLAKRMEVGRALLARMGLYGN